MKLNPNCSEAVYQIDMEVVKNLPEQQLQLLIKLLKRNGESIYNPDKDMIDYHTYFEYDLLDYLLDYFQIPSKRNHWTVNATSELSKKDYTSNMKRFCKRFKLPFKDVYDKRHMGDDVDDAQS